MPAKVSAAVVLRCFNMTDSLSTLATFTDRATRHVHDMATRVEAGAEGASIVALGSSGGVVFATGTPMELLSRITNGSLRNWLVALRDGRKQDG